MLLYQMLANKVEHCTLSEHSPRLLFAKLLLTQLQSRYLLLNALPAQQPTCLRKAALGVVLLCASCHYGQLEQTVARGMTVMTSDD